MNFKPFPEYSQPKFSITRAVEHRRVDLRELPLDSLVQFYGTNPASVYIAKLCGDEEGKKIKIWWGDHIANCIMGPVDEIVSFEKGMINLEEGVMELGKNYFMPTFIIMDGETIIGDAKTETYRKILVQGSS